MRNKGKYWKMNEAEKVCSKNEKKNHMKRKTWENRLFLRISESIEKEKNVEQPNKLVEKKNYAKLCTIRLKRI